jgi:hypothetical protein
MKLNKLCNTEKKSNWVRHFDCSEIPKIAAENFPQDWIIIQVIIRRNTESSNPNTSHLRCDIKMPRREFVYFKIKKENDIFKFLNSQAALHKDLIYTWGSSKHIFNLVRLSL